MDVGGGGGGREGTRGVHSPSRLAFSSGPKKGDSQMCDFFFLVLISCNPHLAVGFP